MGPTPYRPDNVFVNPVPARDEAAELAADSARRMTELIATMPEGVEPSREEFERAVVGSGLV